MASVRKLKRDLNYVMGDIIEAAYIHQIVNPEEDHSKSDQIVEDAITSFNGFIVKINNKEVENRGAHLKQVSKELETEAKVEEWISEMKSKEEKTEFNNMMRHSDGEDEDSKKWLEENKKELGKESTFTFFDNLDADEKRF